MPLLCERGGCSEAQTHVYKPTHKSFCVKHYREVLMRQPITGGEVSKKETEARVVSNKRDADPAKRLC